MKKELKAYYRQIRQLLPGNICNRRKIMTGIESGIEEYCLQNPDADMERIKAHFGRAEDLAAAYVEQQPPKKLLKALQTRKKIVSIVASVMVLMLLIWCFVVGMELAEHKKIDNGHLVVSSEEVTNICSNP